MAKAKSGTTSLLSTAVAGSTDLMKAFEAQVELAVDKMTQLGDATNKQLMQPLDQSTQKVAQGIAGATANAQQASTALQQLGQQTDAAKAKISPLGQEINKSVVEPFGQAMQQTVNGLIQGTVSARQAFASFGENLLAQEVSANGMRLASWVATESAKTVSSLLGLEQRGTAEAASSSQSIALSAATGLKDIAIKAAQAAAGAYAAIASIPIVGPVLAPVTAAAALAAVIALGRSIASAEGGWDRVPADGTLTELHRNEMVLPASIASPLRSAIGSWGAPASAQPNLGGGLASAGGGATTVNLHYGPSISGGSLGSRADAEAFFRNHGDVMVGYLRNAYRNGRFGT
jgi:hypothetical protein